ncbi:tRNA preQ1(34) S-adenosylmethionine ribosyltransferase-isomerase QueA [Calothrix sp. FACHB-1219]|uniref:tRNA preQ1(34) S-adenosylmethionine ribosyltransferase-isomerase QueA n=1 Tax=unclassified Calothrix TaxID=2619626 RepID=UPI0016839F94|nr:MULTISPECIES: tRNA preQ1(34) S-adenosylmethionine ribosyltransferase-isomerase QueA [unclassified Calothrix]MBD2205525.1 tRNA preQ1(34) S-adenosylmethionine ribosyltransferase-isomerase QueA [Calothrix sp. FACHB-168]MBD2220188.1 tRNA preQ1(34) S-adenosylmethionine ribosyltransferase-isomerase QueA [Calothrix sp. FACHB-1219]
MKHQVTPNNINKPLNPEVTNVELDCSLAGYDYELPPELIAQNPVVPRDSSRLLVINSRSIHHIFRELPEILQSGDLLVMNNSRVIAARLYGRKSTGAEVEVLLLEERRHNCWLALVKPGKRFKRGSQIIFEPKAQVAISPLSPSSLTATVLETDPATGGRLLQFELPEGVSLVQVLDVFGEVPLPPYITASEADDEQYQTVYAKHPGAIAAPTAGLHFTPELLEKLRDRGINQAFITLHVGVGTFRPVEVEDVTSHQMHEEWIEVPASTVEQIRATKAAGGRIIAVGTTAVRALEGAAQSGSLQPFCGKTDLFIYPGYKWQVVEGLITNFHLPRSSLLMLVSALIGRQRLLDVYQEAIASRYRFYSFGDAMLILPEAVINLNSPRQI